LTLAAMLCLGAAAIAQEKVYRVAMFGEPRSGNIIAAIGPDATSHTHAALLPLYSSLYGVAPARSQLVPVIAAGDPTPFVLEIQSERIFFTSIVPLRRDVYWSDGTQLTAEDVAFSYNAILALGPYKLGGNWPNMVDPRVVDRVEALDDHTVKFWLKKRPGFFEWQYGVLRALILQKAHWEPVVNQALSSGNPVLAIVSARDDSPVTTNGWAAGARAGASWENRKHPSAIAEFERVVFYESGGVAVQNVASSFSYRSGDTSGAVQLTLTGGPSVDRAIYRFYSDQDAAAQALVTGEADSVWSPASGFVYLGFNLARRPMDVKAFRQAVATVIDKDFVTTAALQGAARALHSVVPASSAYWHNPDVKVWGAGRSDGERLQDAVQLLKESGFTWDKEPAVIDPEAGVIDPGEGLRMPGGTPVPPLELLVPPPGYDPLRSTFAAWVERWLNQLGIPARLRLSDFNEIVDRMNSRQFDMVIMGWGLGTFPDHIHLFFHSSQIASGWNFVGYSNPEFDQVVDQFRAASDLDEARRLNFRAQEILAEDVPYVVLFEMPPAEAYNPRVKHEWTAAFGGLHGTYGLASQVAAIH